MCSHCTCIAGLGEACSHIAAVLFAVESYNKLNQDKACTSQLCAWLPPTMQHVQYAPIARINCTAPITKWKRELCSDEQASPQSVRKSVAPPSHKELSTFYEALSKTGKPAVLSLHPDYSDSYVLDHSKLSTPLSSLLNEECSELPYDELLVKCEEVFEKIQLSVSSK